MVNVNKIQRWLNETGVKDVDFAKMTNISDPGIRKILAGGDTKLSTIFKIAKAMNVSVHEIIIDYYRSNENATVVSEPPETYQTKSEVELLRQMVSDQKEIINLLKEKLKRYEQPEK